MKTIAVLGSTGSIGTQTLEVVEELGNIRVAAISGNQNIDLLEKQARKFRPELVAVMDGKKAELLKSRLADTNIRVCAGMEGLKAAATLGNEVAAFLLSLERAIRPRLYPAMAAQIHF